MAIDWFLRWLSLRVAALASLTLAVRLAAGRIAPRVGRQTPAARNSYNVSIEPGAWRVVR